MQNFDDIFKKYFDYQDNMPNPFDPDSFSQFIKDSISNSFNNPDATQSGPHGPQGDPGTQSGPGAQGGVQGAHKRPNNGANNRGPQQQAQQAQGNNQGLQHNVFETHDHIIIRIAADPRTNPDPPEKLYLNSRELLLKGQDGQTMLHLQLPKPVSAKHTKIDYRNGILEISMLKQSPEPFAEINLTDLFNNGNSTGLQKNQ